MKDNWKWVVVIVLALITITFNIMTIHESNKFRDEMRSIESRTARHRL